MKSIEEQLWDYIDGTSTADEQQAVKHLIETDAEYSIKYQELLQLNNEFEAIELDEPPMAFTYNVMEAIRAEHAQQPLKATINPYIIKGIAAFFILIIVGMISMLAGTIHWSASGAPAKNIAVTEIAGLFSSRVLNAILIFNTFLGIIFLDGYLRKRNISKQV